MARDPQTTKNKLAAAPVMVCPSLLNCDFGILAHEIEDAKRAGAVSVHWDVMDGDFVPNFTYGPPVIKSLRSQTDIVFESHLMMSRPEKYLDEFLDAGCDTVTIHLEAVPSPGDLLSEIRKGGALAGLAVSPPTPVEALSPWLDQIDLILIMSVMPGFGGQSFDPQALAKLQWARRSAPPGTLVQVDGGVNRSTKREAIDAGAQLLVVGSAFYGAKDRKAEFSALMHCSGP